MLSGKLYMGIQLDRKYAKVLIFFPMGLLSLLEQIQNMTLPLMVLLILITFRSLRLILKRVRSSTNIFTAVPDTTMGTQ